MNNNGLLVPKAIPELITNHVAGFNYDMSSIIYFLSINTRLNPKVVIMLMLNINKMCPYV